MLNLNGFFKLKMPVKSYLIFPKNNKTEDVIKSLSLMDYCDVFPSDDEKIIILITETDNEQTDEELWKELQSNSAIQQINLIAAYNP